MTENTSRNDERPASTHPGKPAFVLTEERSTVLSTNDLKVKPAIENFITSCWQTRTGSTTSKFVLMSLAENLDENGFCNPAVRYLVSCTELSERSVRGALVALEKAGFITVKEQFESNGKQIRSKYQLNKAVIFANTADLFL